MSKNLKLSIALIVVFLTAVAIAGVLASGPGALGKDDDQQSGGSQASDDSAVAVVRENSHRLSTADDDTVTLVEFLDFECEACLAAYPFVEQLREKYDGQVTFVVRYFPIPSHANAMNAAIAAEAAAQQGEFEAMYKQLYDTQTEWGERQSSKADVFRTYAEELGLDMEAYDEAVADPATLGRVELDRSDGTALGVEGTPTFFLNGELIQPESADDFVAKIDAALAD